VMNSRRFHGRKCIRSLTGQSACQEYRIAADQSAGMEGEPQGSPRPRVRPVLWERRWESWPCLWFCYSRSVTNRRASAGARLRRGSHKRVSTLAPTQAGAPSAAFLAVGGGVLPPLMDCRTGARSSRW
jgi:hypothetical protein